MGMWKVLIKLPVRPSHNFAVLSLLQVKMSLPEASALILRIITVCISVLIVRMGVVVCAETVKGEQRIIKKKNKMDRFILKTVNHRGNFYDYDPSDNDKR